MLHDPLRTRGRALVVGGALVAIMAAGTAVLTLVRPGAAAVADADLLVVEGSQAMYVRVDKRLHPVANLASARLILGQPAVPQRVREDALGRAEIGFPLGIPGAPGVPAETLTLDAESGVAVETCEYTSSELAAAPSIRKTVTRLADAEQESARENSLTFLAHDGVHTWLIHRGNRARIDPADPAVSRALGIDGAPVRPVGQAMLRSIPEAPPVEIPAIPNRGHSTGFAAPFDTVGNIVQVRDRRVVVLADGAATLTSVLGELLGAVGSVEEATEEQSATIPVAPALKVKGLPDERPVFSSAIGWMCSSRHYTGQADVGRSPGETVAEPRVAWSSEQPSGREIAYPHADGQGPAVDGFIDGRAEKAHALPVRTAGTVHLISPEGTRYKVQNRTALSGLGFGYAVAIDWPMLAPFRLGAELTRQDSLRPIGLRGTPPTASAQE